MYNNVPVLMAMAKALSKINFQYKEIERLYNRVTKIDYTNVEAHEYLALALQKRNQTKRAFAHYKKARKINPTFNIEDEEFNAFFNTSNVKF